MINFRSLGLGKYDSPSEQKGNELAHRIFSELSIDSGALFDSIVGAFTRFISVTTTTYNCPPPLEKQLCDFEDIMRHMTYGYKTPLDITEQDVPPFSPRQANGR